MVTEIKKLRKKIAGLKKERKYWQSQAFLLEPDDEDVMCESLTKEIARNNALLEQLLKSFERKTKNMLLEIKAAQADEPLNKINRRLLWKI